MKKSIQRVISTSVWLNRQPQRLHAIAAIVARCYLAQVFLKAGLTKLEDWDTTLFLFEEEYQVPLLAPDLAAYLGTFGEVFFPVLLVFGFATRFSALGLFVVNLVAVISLEQIAPAALYLHVIWGVLLAQLLIYGGGFFSVDRLIPVIQAKLSNTNTFHRVGYRS